MDGGLIPDWLEHGVIPELVAVAAALVALGVLWRYVARPAWRWCGTVGRGLAEMAQRWHLIESTAARVESIEASIAPTNGDRRSISDRVDTVKAEVTSCRVDIADVVRRQKEHDRHDDGRFGAIEVWSRQFRDFDPMQMPTYPGADRSNA